MTDEKKNKRPYAPPVMKTQQPQQLSVLLICTNEYNCFDEVGYDCCQPNASTCVTNC